MSTLNINTSKISDIEKKIQDIYNKFKNKWEVSDSSHTVGNADYIPLLKNMNSNILQITIIPVSGPNKNKIITISDNIEEMITIQSISKVFTLCLALKRKEISEAADPSKDGRDYLRHFVGTEQSFSMFNSKDAIDLVPRETGIPFTINPFVNAGAIVTTSLVTKHNNKEPLIQIMDNFKLIGGFDENMKISKETYKSEMKYLDHNSKLAHYLKKMSHKERFPKYDLSVLDRISRISVKRSLFRRQPSRCKKSRKTTIKGSQLKSLLKKNKSNDRNSKYKNHTPIYFQNNKNTLCVETALSIYTAQCSVLANSEMLAQLAYTLANNGVNIKGKKVLTPCQTRYVISAMLFGGMYNASGTWFQQCGIPAKSGVGGGIIGVVPGKCAIAVVSPPLNKYGNSYLGTKIFECISKEFNFNMIYDCNEKCVPETHVTHNYTAPNKPELDPVEPEDLLNNIEDCIVKLKNMCDKSKILD